jgi:hypothetical protein
METSIKPGPEVPMSRPKPDPDKPPKVYRDLVDPGDPLATPPELAAGAIEVMDELRWNLQDQNGNMPIVIDTDPEFVDASLDYIREVLTALGERTSGGDLDPSPKPSGFSKGRQ